MAHFLTLKDSGARGHPNSCKETFWECRGKWNSFISNWVSINLRKLLRELLQELWVSWLPFQEWNSAFRKSLSEFRELLLFDSTKWPFLHSQNTTFSRRNVKYQSEQKKSKTGENAKRMYMGLFHGSSGPRKLPFATPFALEETPLSSHKNSLQYQKRRKRNTTEGTSKRKPLNRYRKTCKFCNTLMGGSQSLLTWPRAKFLLFGLCDVSNALRFEIWALGLDFDLGPSPDSCPCS